MTDPAHSMPSQACAILEHLRAGHRLTARDALKLCGSMRLGARVYELNAEGAGIAKRMVTLDRPGRRPTRVAEYFIPTQTPTNPTTP